MDTPSLYSPYIRLDEIRRLMRSGQSRSVADHVGRALRDRPIVMLSSEVAEIGEVLGGLSQQAREKLYEEGFEAPQLDTKPQARMPKRERDRAEHLTALLIVEGSALALAGAPDAATRVEESIGWARLTGSASLETQAWSALAQIRGQMVQHDEAAAACTQALDAARRSEDSGLIIGALNDLAVNLTFRGRPSEAEERIEEATALLNTLGEADAAHYRAKMTVALGRIATLRRQGEAMLTYYREGLRLVDRQRDPLTYMGLLSALGSAYSGYGDEQKNIECQQQMVATAERYGDDLAASWGYYRIGEAFFFLVDVDQAEKAFDLALRYASPHAPLPRLYIYLKRAEICYQEGRERVKEGLEHCAVILDAITEASAPMLAVMTWLQIGLLHQRGENFKEAERAYRKAIEIGGGYESIERTANVKVHLAKVLRALNREAEAEQMAREASEVEVRNVGDERIVAEACRILSEIAEKKGELQEALRYSREFSDRQQAITKRQTEESLQKARVLAEVERLEREAALEREQRRRVEYELAQAVLSLNGKNELLGRVEQQLQRALAGITAEKAREITSSVKNALLQIDTNPSDSGHALGYLKTIDVDFTARLRARYPDLTRKQERLCGLIRAGLTSQEITTVLALGYEGLRAQRKRLRKRLGLDAEGNLENLIAEI